MTVTSINDPEIQRLLSEANADEKPEDVVPVPDDPPDTVFKLAAGYMQDNGVWTKEFEVRELTGRDEEALARIREPGRALAAILSRGLVRVGNTPASNDVIDGLVGGDWETVLVAIRVVTFGPTIKMRYTCLDCGEEYEADIDLLKNVEVREMEPDELSFTVRGRRTYEVSTYTGSTQRQVFDRMNESGTTVADLNTLVLFESIRSIDGRSVIGMDSIRDLPMADRRLLIQEISERRVGPRLQEVKTKCPTCGNEQASPLRADALFR